MDKVIQVLFNTNHEMPGFYVILVLLALCLIVPAVGRYLRQKREWTQAPPEPAQTESPSASPEPAQAETAPASPEPAQAETSPASPPKQKGNTKKFKKSKKPKKKKR